MSSSAIVIILGIFFWVLCAIGIVCLMAYTFTDLMYYRWNREDRLNTRIAETVKNSVEEMESENKQIIVDNVND